MIDFSLRNKYGIIYFLFVGVYCVNPHYIVGVYAVNPYEKRDIILYLFLKKL
jgi:hypothetical protein